MYIRHIKIRYRTPAALLVALIFLLGLGFFSLKQMSEISASSAEIAETWLPRQRALGEINASLNFFRSEELIHVMAEYNQELIDADERIKLAKAQLLKQMEAYSALISLEEEQQLFEQLQLAWNDYLFVHEEMIDLSRIKFKQEARELMTGDSNQQLGELRKVYVALSDFSAVQADQAKQRAGSLYKDAKMLMIVAILAALILTTLFSVVVAQSINKPLFTAIASAKRIANNDLSDDVKVEGNDEISDLQLALSDMQNKLKETLKQINAASSKVSSSADNINQLTDNTNKALNKQNHEIQVAATAVTQMSAAVDDVAANANKASSSSRHTEEVSTRGREHVSQTKQSLEQLENSVTNTAGEIQALVDQVSEISRVLDVIGSIAEQTNLLALNAAIEAARAGEQGRGFSVVADEVRALAHRTQESTQEITQMIERIQSVSQNSVVAMNTSNQHTAKTLALAETADHALEDIMSMVQEINTMNVSIANASEEQANVSHEVNKNLGNIRDLAEHTENVAKETSKAGLELSTLSHDLNSLVASFKL